MIDNRISLPKSGKSKREKKKGKGQPPKMRIALVGNPNCGKTTLFNALTGSKQKTGNFTGVTVEKKAGRYKKDKSLEIVDLPGVYSLGAYSNDERAVEDYFKSQPPDSIINVVDGTNAERNLLLTYRLKNLGIPVCVALNFSDELEKRGIFVDEKKLTKFLGVPVVKVSAKKNSGIEKLVLTAVNNKSIPQRTVKNLTNEETFAVISKALDNSTVSPSKKRSEVNEKIDDFLTHKFFALPVFFLIMTAIYFLSFKIGGWLGSFITDGVQAIKNALNDFLSDRGCYEWVGALFTEGVIEGVGGAVSFAPQILILFTLLSILEEVGYMARVAFIFDRIFASFGLCGKSVVPLALSCGCTVSGVMATRTISDEDERKRTIALCPYLPCSAKTAVFGWISAIAFGGNAIIASSGYFVGVIALVLTAVFMNYGRKSEGKGFFLEIPPLRVPAFKNVLYAVIEKFKDFMIKAGTVICAVSVIVFVLKSFGFNGYVGENAENSFLYLAGSALRYVFYPLGFGSVEASVSVLSGILAKEAVIGSMRVMSQNPAEIFANGFCAYSFMVFVLLSPPCIATLATARKELKDDKFFLFMVLSELFVAYAFSAVINFFGIMYNRFPRLLFSAIVVIIVCVITASGIKLRKKNCSCAKCSRFFRCRGGNCNRNGGKRA